MKWLKRHLKLQETGSSVWFPSEGVTGRRRDRRVSALPVGLGTVVGHVGLKQGAKA